MSKIKYNQIMKINKQLENNFEVDVFSDYGIRKIERLDDELFIELDIYFNNTKDLIARIDLNRIVGSINGMGERVIDMMLTEKHLYNECISKQDRRNVNLLINESKNQKWVDLINKYKEEINNE